MARTFSFASPRGCAAFATFVGLAFRATLVAGILLSTAQAQGIGPAIELERHVAPALTSAIPSTESADPAAPLVLTVILKRTDQQGFESFLRALSDPSAPGFRGYLTQEQLAQRFGPSVESYAATRAWLEQQGFRILEESKNRLTLSAAGTRALAERAFLLRIGDYRLGGRDVFAADRGPSLPAELAANVEAVIGLSNLAHPVRVKPLELIEEVRQAEESGATVGPDNLPYSCWVAGLMDLGDSSSAIIDGAIETAKGGLNFALSSLSPAITLLRFMCAADELNMLNRLAAGLPRPAAVGLSPGSPQRLAATGPESPRVRSKATAVSGAGAGQKIGLLEFDNFNMSDVQDFLNLIGHGARIANLSQVHVAGGAGAPGPDQSEVLLDIAAAMSLAPGAQVVVYDGPFSGRGSFQTMLNAMIGDGVNVISNSWAYCEDQTTLADVQSIETILASAAASGITVVSGSGDGGSTCLNGSANVVHVPASAPHITAVGGTTSHRNIGGTYGSQNWWGGSEGVVKGGQGGFGTSRFFTRPAYQDGLTAAAMRSIPDISMPADPRYGYFICQASAGGCPTNLLYGGTSVAAPLLAAMVAVLNEQTGQPLGFLNAKLYPLANTPSFHSATELGSNFAHVGLGAPNVGRLFLALTNATAGPYDLATSVAGAFPPIVTANGTTKGGIAVLLRDSALNSVSGETVTLTANAGSSAVITPVNAVTNASNGAALFTVTDTVPEVVTFTATVGGQPLAQHPVIRFISLPASFGSVTATPLAVIADGSSKTTITVTLIDGEGNPATGKLITLAQGNGSAMITALNATTDAEGKAKFEAADFKTESVKFTALDVTDGNLPIPGDQQVDFITGGAIPCNIGLGTAAAGYKASTFVSSVPFDAYGCVGPIGLAFAPNGDLLVNSNYSGDIYRFGADGGAATGGALWSSALHGLGPLALLFSPSGKLYAALRYPDPSSVVELDPATGAIQRTIATINSPLDLKLDPLSGDLFVSNFDGVQRISNFANGPGTVTQYYSALFTDGMAFGSDGTLYVKSGCCDSFVARVNGTNTMNPGTFTIAATVPKGDGIGIEQNPGNPSQPVLYVNRVDGIITRVDLSQDPPAQTDIYTNGSRGDFVTVGPDGCFYATQSDRVVKLTKSNSSCSLTPVTTFPTILLGPFGGALQGTTTTFTATLHNVPNPAGTPVTLIVSGANPGLQLASADANGNAMFTYPGVHAGFDQAIATATVGGIQVSSNIQSETWVSGNHLTYINLTQTAGIAPPNVPLTLRAKLIDLAASPPAPAAGQSVGFTFSGKNCSAITDMNGVGTCQVTPNLQSGSQPLTATFAGNGNLLPSSKTASVAILPGPTLLDVDLNGVYDPLTDGLLVLRYMFGLRGSALVANAIGPNAFRTDPTDIAAYLQYLGLALDVDGNQHLDPLTDGMLIFRYLSGLRGNPLLQGVLGSQATRTSGTAIGDYLNALTPAF